MQSQPADGLLVILKDLASSFPYLRNKNFFLDTMLKKQCQDWALTSNRIEGGGPAAGKRKWRTKRIF
jgi:hypothetical protein